MIGLRSALAAALPLLATFAPPPAPTPAQTVSIVVDADAERRPISPLIYGVAFADTAALRELRAPVNRSGGNSASMYNWQADARGAGRDWYYETLPCTPDQDTCFTGDRFALATHAGGASAILTVPTIGWVAQPGPSGAGEERRAAFSVAKYGPQQRTDPNFPDAGNGVRPNGDKITGNDPRDAARPADPAFQRGWILGLVRRFGRADRGGVAY